MSTGKTIRVLVAKPGLDGHDRGVKVIARALRDAGMEVIYVGNQRPEAIVKAAVEENVDFVGLSTLSGNHMELVPVVVRLMREAGIPDIPVLLGGTVPPDVVPKLKAIGVDGIFGPGTALKDIVGHIARRA